MSSKTIWGIVIGIVAVLFIQDCMKGPTYIEGWAIFTADGSQILAPIFDTRSSCQQIGIPRMQQFHNSSLHCVHGTWQE